MAISDSLRTNPVQLLQPDWLLLYLLIEKRIATDTDRQGKQMRQHLQDAVHAIVDVWLGH
jgi:hypothetical protein